MTKWLLVLMTVFSFSNVFAATECKPGPKEQWQDQAKFQENLKAEGYKIDVFKVTKGDCYEIYGKDKAGKKVEIYFNPITGAIVKEKRK